jgi:ribosome-binding protein aMBF1 (putative translation factor)
MSYEKDSYSYVVSVKVVDILRRWMEKTKTSQTGLAQEIGTTQSAVQRWMSKPGSVARGDHARSLEKLVNKIQDEKPMVLDGRVYNRICKYKEDKDMSIEELADSLDMSLYDCITLIERFHGSVSPDSYFKIMKLYIDICEE